MKKIINVLLVLILSISFVSCGSTTKEISADDVTEALASGGTKLEYATYEVSEKRKEKTLKVTIAYSEEVMIVGRITAIRNIIDSKLSKEYPKIDLTIIQEKPEFTSVNYILKDGLWDKEVK